jgi:hypothetical protein
MATLVGSGITCTPLSSHSFDANSNEITVVQNPFQSIININGIQSGDEFELYSINGVLIYAGKNLAKKDFSDLSKGIYFLRLVDQKKTLRVIKE